MRRALSCLTPPVTLSRSGLAVMRRSLSCLAPPCLALHEARARQREGYSSSLEVKVVEDGAWRRTRLPSLWMRWLQLADLPSAVVACSHPTESENGALR